MNLEYFDKDCNKTTEPKACAMKSTRVIEDGPLGKGQTIVKYYVKYCDYLFDPVHMTEIDARYRNWKMREVSDKVFGLYCDYLKTKQEHFRINAERLING